MVKIYFEEKDFEKSFSSFEEFLACLRASTGIVYDQGEITFSRFLNPLVCEFDLGVDKTKNKQTIYT